jgi:hypothetical protein
MVSKLSDAIEAGSSEFKLKLVVLRAIDNLKVEL